MVQTSSLIVFTAVALSSVAAIPLGNQPANGAAQVDATILAQDTALTQAKDRDALIDQKKAKALEAEAKAFDNQAGTLDPALRPSNIKAKEREERERKLREERERKLREERERQRLRESASGNPNRLRTGTAIKPTVLGAPAPLQRRVFPPAPPAPPAQRPVQPQVKSAQVSPSQQISQQNNDLTAMRNKFANSDEERAKALEREAAAYMKQADYLDPALANPKPNFRAGAAPAKPILQKVYRRAGDNNGASAAIATQDKTLVGMKDADAKKDVSEASALETEAQQFTKQADTLDPALKTPGMGRNRADKKRKEKKRKDGQGQGMDRQRKDGQGVSRKAREGMGAPSQAQIARFFFEDDDFFGRDFFDEEELFGRELFDGEELYGREWYDLEELD